MQRTTGWIHPTQRDATSDAWINIEPCIVYAIIREAVKNNCIKGCL